jgi:hypothetical protein
MTGLDLKCTCELWDPVWQPLHRLPAVDVDRELRVAVAENERIGEKDVENGYLSIFVHHRIPL